MGSDALDIVKEYYNLQKCFGIKQKLYHNGGREEEQERKMELFATFCSLEEIMITSIYKH